MEKPVSDEIARLLPELFGPRPAQRQKNTMCTPESGCPPDPGKESLDMLKILAREGQEKMKDKK